MKKLYLLISPRAKSAYFNDYIEVAQAELSALVRTEALSYVKIGDMDFFTFEVDEALLAPLMRLSFAYGLFESLDEKLVPLSITSGFDLHEDFVFGSKFKGKTNELLTQMLINVGLQNIEYKELSKVKLLDPMCGRATTLLWAMRYGIKAKGIEQDPKALLDIRQNVKKWAKVHRQKHEFKEGYVGGKPSKDAKGKFIDFSTNHVSMRVITGNSANAVSLLNGEKFDLLATDIPYGVQHFTTDHTRNPLAVLETCAQGWSDSLKLHGVMVIAFNRYIPKRQELISLFEPYGMQALEFSAQHRMSESIVRDIVVFKKIAS